jgi:hypothetical protein
VAKSVIAALDHLGVHDPLVGEAVGAGALGIDQLGLAYYGVAADDHHAAVVNVDTRLVEHLGLIGILFRQRLQKALAAAVEHLLQQQGVIALEMVGQQGQPLTYAGSDDRQCPDVVAGYLECAL